MKTVRKFVLALLALGSLSCLLAAPSEAHAGTPVRDQPVSHHAYYVHYRADARTPWTYIGYTCSSSAAYGAVNYIRRYGYEAFVR